MTMTAERVVCRHGADLLCGCGTCYCSECFAGACCPDCQKLPPGLDLVKLLKRFVGPIPCLQAMGVALLWVSINRKHGCVIPIADVVRDLQEQGLSRTAAYRHIRNLVRFTEWLNLEQGIEATPEQVANRIACP